MFFPYRDDNDSLEFPYVTTAIIALNVLIFLVIFALFIIDGPLNLYNIFYSFGFIASSPTTYSPITSAFLHAGFGHVLFNMWALWIFGDNVEDRMERSKFILFYLLSHIGAIGFFWIFKPDSQIPLVGASGAISGIMAAYLYLYPYAGIRVFYWFFFFIMGQVRLPSLIFIVIWFAGQVVFSFATVDSDDGGIAFLAHVGGFLMGLILIIVFDKMNWVFKTYVPRREFFWGQWSKGESD